MIGEADVTAILVTRGDQPEAVAAILNSWLDYGERIIWDNSVRDDWKTAGRYAATLEATTRAVLYQDDDVLLPRVTQKVLLGAYQPDVMTAVWGHGENPDGYQDLPLVGAGAVVDRNLPWHALNRYLKHHPLDDDFRYEADFIAGALYERFKHLRLPFNVMGIAQHPSRLCNQSFQKALKLKITDRARAIRDRDVAA